MRYRTFISNKKTSRWLSHVEKKNVSQVSKKNFKFKKKRYREMVFVVIW